MPGVPRPSRPRLLAGLALTVRALKLMVLDREERGPLLLVISLLLGGTVFYMLVEGWTAVDSLYFCAMTLATVGFGDIVPATGIGKLFTVFYVLTGIGILVSFFTALSGKVLALQAERRRARGLAD